MYCESFELPDSYDSLLEFPDEYMWEFKNYLGPYHKTRTWSDESLEFPAFPDRMCTLVYVWDH